MPILDLYKRRKPHTIYLEIEKEKVAFEIPTQYTTEEVERILELQAEKDRVSKEEVEVGSLEEIKLVGMFWDIVFEQILILFEHYNEDVTLSYLKQYVSKEQAIEILEFHTAQHNKNVEEDARSVKKKLIKRS